MALDIIVFYFINFHNISKSAFFINNFNTSELQKSSTLSAHVVARKVFSIHVVHAPYENTDIKLNTLKCSYDRLIMATDRPFDPRLCNT